MSTIRCPQCNLVSWATQSVCTRCAFQFEAAESLAAVSNFQHKFAAQNDAGQNPNLSGASSSFDPYSQTAFTQNGFGEPGQSFGQSGYRPAEQNSRQTNYQNGDRQNYQNRHQPYGHSNDGQPKRKIKLALISMIFGIVGLPPISLILLGLVIAVLGMILGTAGVIIGVLIGLAWYPTGLATGIAALRKVKKLPLEYGGKGFAIAGIVLASLELLIIPVVAAIAIPNLLAARRAANEGAAISTVRKLSDAEAGYLASQSRCGDVQTLIAVKMLDTSLAKNEKNGYRFEVVSNPSGGCEIHATPLIADGIRRSGTRSFYASSSEGWQIRAGDKNGKRAESSDNLLAK